MAIGIMVLSWYPEQFVQFITVYKMEAHFIRGLFAQYEFYKTDQISLSDCLWLHITTTWFEIEGSFQNLWRHNLEKTIAMYILLYILRSKDIQTMKFGQLIEDNMKNIFLKIHTQNMFLLNFVISNSYHTKTKKN